MKRIPIYILILILLAGVFSPIVKIDAQTQGTCYFSNNSAGLKAYYPETQQECTEGGSSDWKSGDWTAGGTDPNGTTNPERYILLEPIPGCTGTKEQGCENGNLVSFDPSGTGKLGEYLNFAIKLFVGLCAVAAVVMIVIAGVEYSTSELISNKEAAKERLRNAILGLLLALGSYTILYTINPDLLNTDVDISGASIVSEGELVVQEIVSPADIGPGVKINGQTLTIRPGSAAPCSSTRVTIGGSVPVNPKYKNTPLCSDLLVKLKELKAVFPNFRISSSVRGGSTESDCHRFNTAKSGNCVDIVVTNGDWNGLCAAIAQVSRGQLNFLNETYNSNPQGCEDISKKRKKKPKHWSGDNLHLNFIGGGGSINNYVNNYSTAPIQTKKN